MSAFIGGRGPHGNGANRLEPTRTGQIARAHEVKQKQITQIAAAKRLKIIDRHIRRLLVRLGKGNAPGGDRQHRCRKSFFRDAFSSGVGRAFHGGAAQAARCAPRVGSGAALGGNSKRARVFGTQVEIERRMNGSHWLRFRNRYLRLRHCPAAAPPRGKSFRPTASRTHRQSTLKSLQNAPPSHPWRTFQHGRKPDISNNVGSVKRFLSELLRSLRRVVIVVFFGLCIDDHGSLVQSFDRLQSDPDISSI
jgi:hypothetical protein